MGYMKKCNMMPIEIIVLERYHKAEDHTNGKIIYKDLCIETLEPAWKNNQKSISSIPYGKYLVVRRNSKKFGDHFKLVFVKGRDMILIHSGNQVKESSGCILVGQLGAITDYLYQSRSTLKTMLDKLPEKFILHIK